MIKKYLLIFLGILFIAVIFKLRKENRDNDRKELIGNLVQNSVSELQEKPWFTNTIYGISVETPEKLEPQISKVPEGYEEFIKKSELFGFKNENFIVLVTYMDSNYETFDINQSQKSSIGNLLHIANGSNLKLFCEELKNGKEEVSCTGKYNVGNLKGIIKGYAYWNGNGKYASINCLGFPGKEQELEEVFDKILTSIRIAF